MPKTIAVALFSAAWLFTFAAPGAEPAPPGEYLENWPTWRGPYTDGHSPKATALEWSEDKNIQWKIPVPGSGSSTPIIWKDRIFILTAIDTGTKANGEKAEAAKAAGDGGDVPKGEAKNDEPEKKAAGPDRDEDKGKRRRNREGDDEKGDRPRRGRGGPRGRGGFGRGGGGGRGEAPTTVHQFVVLCYDRETGRELWRSVAREAVPHEGFRVGDNGYASGSPVTDGQRLYASFGSHGIYCYDLEGKKIWEADLGDMETRNGFGEGASPALFGNRLVVPWDHEGQSFIACLDANTGDVVWKVDRDEKTSWGTPLILEGQPRSQVVVNGTNRVRSYDLANGELIWESGGQTTNAIPSPMISHGNFIVMSGFRGSAVFAIPYGSAGDLTGTDKYAWHYDGESEYRAGTPYVPSGLITGNLLYFLKSNDPILTCMSVDTGKVVYDRKRLEGLGTVYASPVATATGVYIVGRGGKTAVIKHGPTFEVLATNELDDGIDASPAVYNDQLFLRGKESLYCIKNK